MTDQYLEFHPDYNDPVREPEVTISEKEYKDLLDSQLLLSALEGAGVDNWCGYSDAMEWYEEEKGD